MYSLVPEVARIAPTGGSLSRNTRRRNAHLAHVKGQTAARLRRFRGWTGKTFLSRIPFKSAVNAGRASKGPGVRVAYKEKNRLRGGGRTGRRGEEHFNLSIVAHPSVGCNAVHSFQYKNGSPPGRLPARRRIDSYLERFAHLSASKTTVPSLYSLAALSPKCEFGRFISGGQFRPVLLPSLPAVLSPGGGVGFQAAFIVCVSCHFGLVGWMDGNGSHQNACSDFLENEEAKFF